MDVQQTPPGAPAQTTRLTKEERQARIERVKQDLAWAIEQTVRDIRALEAYIAEQKQQPKPRKVAESGAGE